MTIIWSSMAGEYSSRIRRVPVAAGLLSREQLGPALDQAEEQGQHERTQNQPAGNADADDEGTGDGTEHEARRQNEHVQQDDMLQPE